MSTAKGRILYFNEKSIDYITFGKGKETLIMIPDLGDGLNTVKGMAQSLSFVYRHLGKKYQVYIFSRINELPQKYSTKDMAADIAEAMNALSIESAFVLGGTRWNDCSAFNLRLSRKGEKIGVSSDGRPIH